jgi:hypothetical protein
VNLSGAFRENPWLERLFAGLLLLAALTLVVAFFERIPIEGTTLAIDWTAIWTGVQGGRPHYETGMAPAPWAVVLLIPLGWLSLRASWGVMSLVTLGVLAASVAASLPAAGAQATAERRTRWLGILLLTASYLSLRQLADGNIEALVIGGILLVLHGYARRNEWTLAAGIVLGTGKLQETWLLMLVLGAYLLWTWPAAHWLRAAALVAAVVVPCLLWFGRDWLTFVSNFPSRGALFDTSLGAASYRLGLPQWLTLGAWAVVAALTIVAAVRDSARLGREKAGMLVAASLLLAPYSAGNSFLTVLAIGIMPLLVLGRPAGVILYLLSEAPLLASRDIQFRLLAYYWTALLLLCWGLLLARLWQARRQPGPVAAPAGS